MNYNIYDKNIAESQKIVLEKYKNPKAYVHTFGCQQNVSDSERIKGMLKAMGYDFTDKITDADFVLFNTCAIREGAELKIFGNIGELKHRKKEHPDMIIALCGCMVQQDRIIEKIKKSYPFVSLCFGTHLTHLLPEMIKNILSNGKKIFRTDGDDGTIPEYVDIKRDCEFKANIPIMNGCNNFCSYCIVPYVRGREKSRMPDDIIAEIKEAVNSGVKEITLLGQNVNSYGKNLAQPVSFAELLRKANEVKGDFIIRFMTSHPKDCTFELIKTIAECEKVSKHIHLPIQSGSNLVLKAMNRGYTREKYLELVNFAKEKIPEIAFTSDIIVGFPTERYEDFLETVDLIKQVEFSQLFTFIFSKRPGTKAAEMEDIIPSSEKSKWMNQLLEVQSEIGYKLNKKLIGRTEKILADGYGKSEEACLTGRTMQNTIVDFKGSPELIGKFVNVKITKATPFATFGELIKN